MIVGLILGGTAVTLLALVPLLVVWLRPGEIRYRRETAMALHRAQLEELDHDRAEGRIPDAEYEGARLEIARRLLAADQLAEPDADHRGRFLLIATFIAVPLVSVILFLPGSLPLIPSEPHAVFKRQVEMAARRDDALISKLEAKLATMNPRTEEAREGYILLGQALAERQDPAGAAKAWRIALQTRFDPTLAAETAEAESEAAGHVTPNAVTLFKQALAHAPQNAPWRGLAEQRLREAAVSLPKNAPTQSASGP